MDASEYLGKYIEECKPVMRLWGDEIKVSEEPCPGSYAEVNVCDAHHTADIQIGEEFWELDAEKKRQIIAHELIHIHLCRIMFAMKPFLHQHVPASSVQNVYDSVDTWHEIATDELSRIISVLLPPWDESAYVADEVEP